MSINRHTVIVTSMKISYEINASQIVRTRMIKSCNKNIEVYTRDICLGKRTLVDRANKKSAEKVLRRHVSKGVELPFGESLCVIIAKPFWKQSNRPVGIHCDYHEELQTSQSDHQRVVQHSRITECPMT